MFKFDPQKRYLMPAHFGVRGGKGSGSYGDVTGMSVTYLTDRDILSKYMPEPMGVGAEPLVTVSSSMSREIEWLAGGSYNIVGVNASAVFNGEVDHITGSFCLVMWENLTDPIISGREGEGIPKIYADIPDHTAFRGEHHALASYRGHKIVDITVKDLKPVPQDRIDAMNQAAQGADSDNGGWMGWKYIPNTGKPGAEVSHATLYPSSGNVKEMSVGTGEVKWHRLTWEQNPTQHHIVNALEELPIIEYRAATVTRSSSTILPKPVRPLR